MLLRRAGTGARAGGGLVTFGTVAGLLVAIGLTLFGVGAANHTISSFDASSWLWSSNKGEVSRANGVTGRVDTRYKVQDSQGHSVQVSQTDRYVVLRDLTTGKISVLDLSTLRLSATAQTTPGLGVTVALHGDAAFVIDSVQGVVSQLNPATLVPTGEPLRFPPGLAGGTFDDTGTLWLLVPGEGTVVAVRPAVTPSPTSARGGAGGGAGADPRVVATVAVGDPSHDLAVTVLDHGVAVLDKTAMTLTTLRGDARHTVALPLTGPGAMPGRSTGTDLPVTVVDDRHVYVVHGDRVTDFPVPGDSPRLAPCVGWSGRLYCPDESTGTVYVLDATGRPAGTIAIPRAGGALELEVREGHLFINAPGSATARVVDDKGRVKVVDKYANNILGGDPPPTPPPPPPTRPAVGPPGAPVNVAASAGNTTARVTWGAAAPNGAAVTRYVVEGDGTKHEVGAGQRALDVTGLTNGRRYTFTVYAVNAKGAGPKRAANPVVPTSDVPDPPASVTAKENPDGTVKVSWPAANGLGRKIVRYDVTGISAAGPAPVGSSATTTLVIPAGKLTYGTQYAFTVASVNDKGAASKPSPLSNTVVPYGRPGAPKSLSVTTAATQRGAVAVQWQPAADNGRPITTYVVDAGAVKQDVTTGTAVTLTGFADGASVKVSVTAVNAAGAGPAATGTATTIRPPALTVTAQSAGYNSITVTFSTDNGGSPATTTCTLSVAGAGSAKGSCTSLTVGGLWPAGSYAYTLTAANAAGSASATGALSTPALYGTVLCSVPSYCGPGAPLGGVWVYTTPSQAGTAVGDVFNPERYQATCWTTDAGGQTINAKPYGGKQDNRWIRIRYKGDNYLPFAWFRLDGGDNPTMLPHC
jgi:fibronectin type III domain protein